MTSFRKYFKNPKHQRSLEWAVLVLLVAIAAVTLFFVVRKFEIFRLRGSIRPMRNHAQVLAAPEQIQSWMTFRYINTVFRLQPDYLKMALDVTDQHYPNLSINALARQQQQTSSLELEKVIAAIKNPQK